MGKVTRKRSSVEFTTKVALPVLRSTRIDASFADFRDFVA